MSFEDDTSSSYTMISCPSSLSSARSFASSSYRAGSLLDFHDQLGVVEVNRAMQHSPEFHMGPRNAASVSGSLRVERGVMLQPNLRSALSYQNLAHKHADRSAHFFRLPPPRPIMRDIRESPRKGSPQRESTHFHAHSSLHRHRKDSPLSYFSTSCSRSSSYSSSCTCSVDSPSNCSPSPRKSLEAAYESSSQVPECSPREVFVEPHAPASQNTFEMESTIENTDSVDNSKLLQSKLSLPIPPEYDRRCIKPSTNHTRHFWMRHIAPTADTLPDTWLDLIKHGRSAKESNSESCLWAPERLWACPQQRPTKITTNKCMSQPASPWRSLSKLPQPPDDIADIRSAWNEVAEDADVGPVSPSPLKSNRNKLNLGGSKNGKLKLRNQSVRATKEELSSQAAADHWSTFVDDADDQSYISHSINDQPNANTWSLQNQQALGEWKNRINMLKVRRNRLLEAEVESERTLSRGHEEGQDVKCSSEQAMQKINNPVEISAEGPLSSGEEDWCIEPSRPSLEEAGADTSVSSQHVEPPLATWRHHRRASTIRSQVDSSPPNSSRHLAQNCNDAHERIKHQALQKLKTISVVEAFSKPASRRSKAVHADTWILDDANRSYAAQSGGRAKRRQSIDGRLPNEEIPQIDESKNKMLESRRAVKFTDVPDQISPRVARQSLHRLKTATAKIIDDPELQGRVKRKSLRSSSAFKPPNRSKSSEL